jgi:succinyl-CoA synthetase alpha subunit
MAILVNSDSRIIVQGLTGKAGTFHAKACKEYGSKIVGGVTPGKGGTIHEGWPIFNSVAQAVKEVAANVSLIFVPAPYATDAILEAIDSQIPLIICITEGIPVLDMLKIKTVLAKSKSILIGPNCPGVITPGECKAGIMPAYIHARGGIGVVSRSGTLTYEAVYALTQNGLGQSTCVGIGGDPILGTSFWEILQLFKDDPQTEAVVMIGEIGGSDEIKAAEWAKANNFSKPLFAFLAGRSAPKGKRMGHAGAIIASETETVEAKADRLSQLGVKVVHRLSELPDLILSSCKLRG